MNQIDLSQFVHQNKLGADFSAQAQEYFVPLAREIVNLHQNKRRSVLVGVNGAQGSGKSTLSELLVHILKQKYGLKAISLSLDDFYYAHHERQHLGHSVHPLLATRGVPGTHDVMLTLETIHQLLHHNNATIVPVPRFNKATDDRHEETQWTQVSQAPDIILFEGWCVGATAQDDNELTMPVNALEEYEDKDGHWRHYVNEQLKHHYEPLFAKLDCLIMLKAPNFDCVYQWRLEQEQKLIASLDSSSKDSKQVMNEQQIARFIQHYQRITQHLLQTLPDKAHIVFELDKTRKIQTRLKHTTSSNFPIPTLIFTDLDGSLLDHHSYSHMAADSTLKYLEQNQIPVIPCSSKTQAEIEKLRSDLNNPHPFITENGAAVYISKSYFPIQPSDTHSQGNYWVKTFVEPHEFWLQKLNSVRDDFNGLYKPFSAMTIEEITQATDLSIEQASLAAKRQFGEPVLWLGTDAEKQQFIHALQNNGAHVLQGGRFLHVCGDANKGKALIWLTGVYQQLQNKPFINIAIGDSHNDIQMLDMADKALVIRSPVHSIPNLSRVDDIYISDEVGPAGWAQGVNQILDDLIDLTDTQTKGEHHG